MITQYRGVMVVLGAIGIVWIASYLQLLQIPDGWIYDQAVRLGSMDKNRSSPVLMVENQHNKTLSASEGHSILQYLQALGAAHVIFLTKSMHIDDQFIAQAQQHGGVILAAPYEAMAPSNTTITESTTGMIRPEDWSDLPVGLLHIPSAEYGIHRYGSTHVTIEDSTYSSLGMVVATKVGKQPEPGRFRINFNQGSDSLPRVSIDRVLNKGLIPELVSEKTVIIGNTLSTTETGLYTPLNSGDQGLSLLEFQAYLIDTLLGEKQITTIPWVMNLLILGLIGLISLLVYQWFNLDRSGWFTLFLIGCYFGVAWALLHSLQVWIPVMEIAIAQILMFWFFVRFKLLHDDQEMRQTVLQRMTKIQEYMLPPDFYHLDEHWAQVITFVDQTLNLNRVIFLEKVENDHRVREVQALRCSLQDIDERRRDYERVPYSDAIEENGPIKLEHRLFFSTEAENTYDQYLMPLLFGGEVQGFWAFDIDPNIVKSSDNFLGNIRNFGNQIAELLYHRHRWLQQRDAEKKVFRRFFRLEANKAVTQEVKDLLELLDKRLIALQAVFDGLTTASIHYDLFGRVIHLNHSMEEFMRQQNLPGYKLTALDLLVKLSDMTPDQVRHLLRQVVVDQRDFLIPVNMEKTEDSQQSVHIRPLTAPETETQVGGSQAPFELAGILFELNSQKDLKTQLHTKEQLLEWLRLQLRSELGSLLEDDDVPKQLIQVSESNLHCSASDNKVIDLQQVMQSRPADVKTDKSHTVPSFYTKVCEILSTLEKVQTALTSDWNNLSTTAFPLDVYPLLISALEAMKQHVSEKGLTIKNNTPRLMGLIYAQPDQLKQLFESILDILITDAAADTDLIIDVLQNEANLTFKFNNIGFGIPDEHLQSYIWQSESDATDEFKKLREAVQPIQHWHGNIAINSEVGTGIWTEIKLKTVN